MIRDFHRHFTASPARSDAIYCTSREDEWIRLEDRYSSCIGSFDDHADLMKIRDMLDEKPHMNMGEFPLDERLGDIERQKRNLEQIIDIAYEKKRVLTLHVVRKYDILYHMLREREGNLPQIILHSWNQSIRLMEQLARFDVIFSMNERAARTRMYKDIAETENFRVVMETDYEGLDDENYEETLERTIRMFPYDIAGKNNESVAVFEN